jgi:hypothetical protein
MRRSSANCCSAHRHHRQWHWRLGPGIRRLKRKRVSDGKLIPRTGLGRLGAEPYRCVSVTYRSPIGHVYSGPQIPLRVFLHTLTHGLSV